MRLINIDIKDNINIEKYINSLFYLGNLNIYNDIYLSTNIDIKKYLPCNYNNYNKDIYYDKILYISSNHYITNDINQLFTFFNIKDIFVENISDTNILKHNPDRYGEQYISYFTISKKLINIYLDNLNLRRYTNFIEKYKYIIDEIEKIVKESKEDIEGNCFTEDKSGRILKELVLKQVNIFNMGQISNLALEIGFNAGHSAVLLLLANPNLKLYVFDICFHRYTLKCYEYIKKIFGDRIELYIGDSTITINEFKKQNINVDLAHIDGCHLKEIAEKDFYNTYDIIIKNGLIIWDDSHKIHLNELENKFIEENLIVEKKILPTFTYNHNIYIKI